MLYNILPTNEPNINNNNQLIMLYTNIVANILYIIFKLIAFIRYDKIKCLLTYFIITYNAKEFKSIYASIFIGLQMHKALFIFFYLSLFALAFINLIILLKSIKNEDTYEKYFKKQISKYFFIIFILASIFNVYGYSINEDDDYTLRKKVVKTKLWLFLFNLIFSLIVLIILYYYNYIQNEKESNEDKNLINFGKIFYDAFLVFHIYFLFYIIEELKLIYTDDLDGESGIPYKFEKRMAIIVELLFGLIGLGVIYLGKAIVYGIYQIFIYVAFLIYRNDIDDFDDMNNFSFMII